MEFSVLRNKNDSSSYDANMFGHVRPLTELAINPQRVYC